MYYAIGLFRRTALWSLIALPISLIAFRANFVEIFHAATAPNSLLDIFCAFMFWSILAYPLIAGLHILIVKISSRHDAYSRTAAEAYFSALGWDLIAPVQNTGLFLLVITRKHIIKDDSALHNAEDFAQVVCGFVWVLVMAAFIAFGLLNIGKL